MKEIMNKPERPAKRQPRRIHRELTPKERQRLETTRQEAESELPHLLHRAEQLEAALQEDTVSGGLRKAIVASELQYVDLARHAGISPQALADFMVGETELNSAAFDRLAEALGCRLVTENA